MVVVSVRGAREMEAGDFLCGFFVESRRRGGKGDCVARLCVGGGEVAL